MDSNTGSIISTTPMDSIIASNTINVDSPRNCTIKCFLFCACDLSHGDFPGPLCGFRGGEDREVDANDQEDKQGYAGESHHHRFASTLPIGIPGRIKVRRFQLL